MGPMIPKEMKYNLHYGKVRGDVLLELIANVFFFFFFFFFFQIAFVEMSSFSHSANSGIQLVLSQCKELNEWLN